MIEIEIDGKQVEVAEGSTVMDAANKIGVYIPHFCYHKKLSIAANCRMCLVQVDKAPKPLPACATPATNGMKAFSHSEQAVKAQKGVMEFLLINHPLDCPICDQGGECQLQDLAVGYGSSNSRYQEEKRVVLNKDLGALISTDMTRCIHCTRCVRFGQEIAGIMELGMAGRGEHSEILAFVNRTVDSELSGNVIDLCPVGALTSKPFRFSARTWELARRKSVSPHDGLGANLIVQTKNNKVMRVLPLENEQINECWLSDKDRFSYEALNSQQRLTRPMVKQGGEWREVDWHAALDYVAHALKNVAAEHGPQAIAAAASPHSTLEELYLLQRLVRGMGGGSVDFRLRQSDFSLDGKLTGAPWLGMRIEELNGLDRVLVVGSFLRKDHPLLTQRLRQAAKGGAQVSLIHASADDLLMPVHSCAVAAPAAIPAVLAQVVKGLAQHKGVAIDPALAGEVGGIQIGEVAQRIAASLAETKNGAVFLGNPAQQHPRAALIHRLAQEVARLAGTRLGFLGEAANSMGGYVAGALPFGSPPGLNASEMFRQPRRAYILLNAEPELDCHDPRQALAALKGADSVVVMTPFKDGGALDYADCLLPTAPFSETPGTFINTEGRVQSFNAVVAPLQQTRPAWKVLRVLGTLLGIDGFGYDSAEQVRGEALSGAGWDRAGGFLTRQLNNECPSISIKLEALPDGIQRVADVPIYFADALVRRAPALQRTRDAAAPRAGMNAALAAQLGGVAGDRVRVRQDAGEARLELAIDESVAPGCVRLAAAHATTASLGPMFGEVEISVERG